MNSVVGPTWNVEELLWFESATFILVNFVKVFVQLLKLLFSDYSYVTTE